jgi:hypothetical protein
MVTVGGRGATSRRGPQSTTWPGLGKDSRERCCGLLLCSLVCAESAEMEFGLRRGACS